MVSVPAPFETHARRMAPDRTPPETSAHGTGGPSPPGRAQSADPGPRRRRQRRVPRIPPVPPRGRQPAGGGRGGLGRGGPRARAFAHTRRGPDGRPDAHDGRHRGHAPAQGGLPRPRGRRAIGPRGSGDRPRHARRGASGYVLKDSDGDEILTAVSRAAEGGALLSSQVTPRVIEELTEALERERRRIRELEAAQAALVERSARRQQLVARLSHELRTPVTVILGVAQTLAEVVASPEQEEELLARLVTRARDLAQLVERFELAIDAGLTERVDVGEVALDVAAHDERVTVTAVEGLPPANLNRGVAGRILEELVDNALRFSSPTTGVEVTISAGTATIEVRVVDEGPGIDPREHERVFGPLEQLEELNVRIHQGVGMGLALARTAARAMGGDVVIESSSAAGTTFLWTIALTS